MLSEGYLYYSVVVTWKQYVVSPVTDTVALSSVTLVEMRLFVGF